MFASFALLVLLDYLGKKPKEKGVVALKYAKELLDLARMNFNVRTIDKIKNYVMAVIFISLENIECFTDLNNS